MNDQDELWADELDAYVQAYADEEHDHVDAAAAYDRFNRARLDEHTVVALGRRRAAVFAVLGVALAAGLVSIWVSSGRTFRLADADDPATLTQDAADTSSEAQAVFPTPPTPPRQARSAGVEEPAVAPLEAPGLSMREVPAPDAVPTRRPRPSPKPDAHAPSSPRSDLARELTMLGELRKAARAREYANALTQVRAYRAQFPDPTLAAERDLIEIEALCGLGRVSQANDAKKAFSTAHPKHHLRAKAEHMCEKKHGRVQNADDPRHQDE